MTINILHIAEGFHVLERHEPALNTLEVSWRMLKPILNDKFVRARQQIAEAARTALKGLSEIDHYLLRITLRNFSGDDEAILKSVVILATADDQKRFELDYANSDGCLLCGSPGGGMEYLIDCCPTLSHIGNSSPIAKLLPLSSCGRP